MLYSLIPHIITALNGPDFASFWRHVGLPVIRQLTDYR
jgi:hypothetical protein